MLHAIARIIINAVVRTTLLTFTMMLITTSMSVAADKPTPQTYYYFVFSNPVAGMEVEYNRWYDEQHALDVVAIPGFVTAQRFVISDDQMRPDSPPKPKYLVVYKIVTDNLAAVSAEVTRRIQSGETKISPAFDIKSAIGVVYRALGPEVAGAGGEPSSAHNAIRTTYYQFVFADPVVGRDEEFNHWYDEHHAPEVASTPGIVSWQRAILSPQQFGPSNGATHYLAMFKIVTADLPAVLQYFHDRMTKGTGGPMTVSDAFDNDHTYGYTYKAIGPLLQGDQIRAQRARSAKQ